MNGWGYNTQLVLDSFCFGVFALGLGVFILYTKRIFGWQSLEWLKNLERRDPDEADVRPLIGRPAQLVGGFMVISGCATLSLAIAAPHTQSTSALEVVSMALCLGTPGMYVIGMVIQIVLDDIGGKAKR